MDSGIELVLKDIRRELARAEEKFSTVVEPDLVWLAVLTEELGEAARALLPDGENNLYTEVIQIASVAIRWAENIHKEAHRKFVVARVEESFH